MNPAELVLYFDGKCPFCVAQMRRLGKWNTRQSVAFVDIAEPGFDPASLGADMAALNRGLHGRLPDGRVLTGIDSVLAAYTLVGRGWLVWPLRVPGLRNALAMLYRSLARNRHALSRLPGYRSEPACDGNACGIGKPCSNAPERVADQPSHDDARRWVVRWMVGAAIIHVLVGAALSWMAGSTVFDAYHYGIERHFWAGMAPPQARGQQIWWISLFGATLQCAAIWMLALVHLGNRLRKRAVWGWLLAGLLVWAPQDMLISLQAHAGTHVAADVAALVSMVPPLAWLLRRDPA
ncbi:thiol-disulfide oxidoreductase DCC family protein [Burkholderia sp. F1]|uniref:thiol-disulfide oxidoreductase DCC family protein n=1 Tax=Burkholderia sp. F1 TaxID=3366817 RepID=UPI003D754C87